MTSEVIPGYYGGVHLCPCCGCRRVKDIYDYCYGCHSKWMKVFKDCQKAGYSTGDAAHKADEAYPRNFAE